MEINDFSFKNINLSNCDEYSLKDFEEKGKILDIVESSASIGLTKESDHINSTLHTMSIDAQFDPNTCESLLQIEVSTNLENPGDINELEFENQAKKQMETHRDYSSCLYEKLEDSELSYVMNDHNYISQRILYSQKYFSPKQQTTDIREVITKFLLRKEETDKSNYLKIDSFVDNIMHVITSFNVSSEDSKEFLPFEKEEKTDSNGNQHKQEIKESSENKTKSTGQHTVTFKKEIIEKEFLTNQEMTEFEKIINSHPSDNKMPQFEKIINSHPSDNKMPHISVTSKHGFQDANAILMDQGSEKSDSKYINSITKEVSCFLPENSSEPIEYFEFSSETSLDDSSDNFCQKDVIKNIFIFARKLSKQCKSFNGSNELNEFLLNQLLEFKKIVNMVCCIDSSVQTEKLYSKRKLRRINAKEKKLLLASSYSSSTSDEKSDLDQYNSDNMIYKFQSSKSSNSLNSLRCHESDHNKKPCLESVNIHNVAYISQTESDKSENILSQKGDISKLHLADISKYTDKNLEVPDKGTISNATLMSKKCSTELESEIDSNESDKENSTHQKFEEDVSDMENIANLTNSAEKRCITNDFDDKEINRLINLKDLLKSKKKPSIKNSPPTLEKLKLKSKSLLTRKLSNTLITVMQEVVTNNTQTDESMSDSGDPALTEKQFLKQCNDRLKHQLLEASSESEFSDDDEKLQNLLIKDKVFDDEDRKSPLVDKFLKAFNVTDLDNDGDNKIESFESTVNIDTKSKTNEITIKGSDVGNENLSCEKNFVSTEEKTEKKENQFLGCDILSESLKRTPKNPKSLEKLLSEADKRKKIAKVDENLISLSSASDSSDIEECSLDVSEEQKKRLIKPMLRQDQLAGETRKAQKEEADRIRRLERKHTLLCKAKKEFSKEVKNDLILDYNSETKTFIKVHPEIVKHLKTHQIDGIKFMYDSCYGGVDALKKSEGSGCILAHCMGLGKTLQLIALLHTVISYKELKTSKILVLCPKSTVMNWADEIFRWLGPLNTKTLRVFSFNDTSDINEKLDVLHEWSISSTKAGCLLIGYEAFRTLVFYHNYKNRVNLTKSRLEDIKEKVLKYLLKPGADLVVCDEGHIIKNRKSAISLAVSEIVTPRRIILTGTPIQNNLKEYYSMVNFIKPLFLGTEKEFANLYANPIKNGQHKDSSKRDIKVMKQRSFVLHKKLSKFVQRKEAELLKTFLPPKFEYVLFVPMTEIQNNLYEFILEAISKREDNKGKSLITDYTCLRKIWTHPKVLEDAWKNAVTAKNKKYGRRNAYIHPHSDDDQPDDFLDSQTGIMSVTRDWWRNLLSQKDLQTIFPSNKLRTMFEILRMCEENGEKCLIFSAFVAVLNVVEFFLKKMQEIHANNSNEVEKQITWILGQDYYRLDGKTPKSIRHEMIKRFNDPNNKKSRVFLISAKAGGQGINLTGANRVIILDTSWNPSNDQQNIFRIFRLGQQKNCYIYRLIAMGTMEEKVYSRSVTKQAMSFRVVDEQQIDRHYSMAELAELYTLTKPNYAERPMPIFPQDNILANLLLNYPHLVYKYHEHDSLLENKMEQELSEQEKADAWAAYERDLQVNSEMKNPASFEGIVNPFSHISAQNYLATIAGGFDARNFPLSYGLNQQTVGTAPLTQSLLSNYNFSGNNQAYFDMMNMYRNFSPSLLYGMNQTSTLQQYGSTYGPVPQTTGVLPSQAIPSMLSASSSNSLSALGSISSFNASNTVFPPQLPMFSSSSPSYPPTSTPAINHTTELSSFEQYKRSLENSFSNLSNYTSSFSNFSKRKDLSYAMTLSPSSATKQASKKTTSQNSFSNALPVIESHHTTLSLPMVSTSTNSLLGCNSVTNSDNIPINITNANISVNLTKKGEKNKILVEKPNKNIYPETTTENLYSASKSAVDTTYLSLGEKQLEVTNPTSSANKSMVYPKKKLPLNYNIDSLSKTSNNYEEMDLVQDCSSPRERLKRISNPFSTDIALKILHENSEKQIKLNEIPNSSKNCLGPTTCKPSTTTSSTLSTLQRSKLSKKNLPVKTTEISSKNSLRALNYGSSNDVCFSSVKKQFGKNDSFTVSAINDSNVKSNAIRKTYTPNPTFHTTNLSQKSSQHKVKIPSLSLSTVDNHSSNVTSAIISRTQLNPNTETKRTTPKNSTRFSTASKPAEAGVFIIKNNKNSKISEELFAEKSTTRSPLERKRIATSPTANNSELHCNSPQVKQMKLALPQKKNNTRQCNTISESLNRVESSSSLTVVHSSSLRRQKAVNRAKQTDDVEILD